MKDVRKVKGFDQLGSSISWQVITVNVQTTLLARAGVKGQRYNRVG